MYDRTLENRLHLFENVAADNHDTIYELLGAFFDLCKMLSRKDILTNDEFDSIVNKRRYKPTGESAPVVHAHWIKKEDCTVVTDIPWSMCSACGEYSLKLPYCAFCGAKMDAEEDTQETHKP